MRRNVLLNMRDVRDIGSDAIAVILACLKSAVSRISVYGRWPSSQIAIAKLVNSGFPQQVSTRVNFPISENAMLLFAVDRRVLTQKAREIALFALRHSRPECCDDLILDAIAGTIGEFMQNTYDHAVLDSFGQEPPLADDRMEWVVHAEFVPETRVTHISFVDLGVGLLGSIILRNKVLATQLAIGMKNDSAIVGKIMRGEIKVPSRTGDPRRGVGLPLIHKHYESKHIGRLIVISNRAFVDFERAGQPRDLRIPFPGTFMYFEVRPTDGQPA